jgi:hypothetical protein
MALRRASEPMTEKIISEQNLDLNFSRKKLKRSIE